MCRVLSRYFIVPGKGQLNERERGREGGRSFREGQVMSMLASFSLSLSLSLLFCALSQSPSNTFAFNYQARGQN